MLKKDLEIIIRSAENGYIIEIEPCSPSKIYIAPSYYDILGILHQELLENPKDFLVYVTPAPKDEEVSPTSEETTAIYEQD